MNEKEKVAFETTVDCIVCGEESGYEGIKAKIRLSPDDIKKISVLVGKVEELHNNGVFTHLKTDCIGDIVFQCSNNDAPTPYSTSICISIPTDCNPEFYWDANIRHSPNSHIETGLLILDKDSIPVLSREFNF